MLPVHIKCQDMQLLYVATLSRLPQLWETLGVPPLSSVSSESRRFWVNFSSSCALPLSSFAWSKAQTPSGHLRSNSACLFFFFFFFFRMESARLQTASDPAYPEGLTVHMHTEECIPSGGAVRWDDLLLCERPLWFRGQKSHCLPRRSLEEMARKKSRCTKAVHNAFDLLCNNESSPPHRPAWHGLKVDL